MQSFIHHQPTNESVFWDRNYIPNKPFPVHPRNDSHKLLIDLVDRVTLHSVHLLLRNN